MIPDFEKVIGLLNESKVEFVVIGGAAIVAHGVARATFDLDVCYERSPTNIERLCDALEPYNARLRGAPDGLPFRFDAKTVQRGLNFTLSTSLGSLDFLGEVSGIGPYSEVERSRTRRGWQQTLQDSFYRWAFARETRCRQEERPRGDS